MEVDYYTIGQRIRHFRKGQGLSQEELAERVHISTTHMSHIETGNTKLSISVFIAIAKALDVSCDELINDAPLSRRQTGLVSINDILDSCDANELLIISEIVKASKIALDKFGNKG